MSAENFVKRCTTDYISKNYTLFSEEFIGTLAESASAIMGEYGVSENAAVLRAIERICNKEFVQMYIDAYEFAADYSEQLTESDRTLYDYCIKCRDSHQVKMNNVKYARDKVLFLDTETTGLNYDGTDEIVQIAIIDGNGKVLCDTLVKPVMHTEWIEAQRIHGISPEDVKDAPTMEVLKPQLVDIFKNSSAAIIYNAGYDFPFLTRDLGADNLQHINVMCCMEDFAEVYGEINEYYGTYRWQKLSKAMDYYGIDWQGTAHAAMADTIASKAVWEKMHPDFYASTPLRAKGRAR